MGRVAYDAALIVQHRIRQEVMAGGDDTLVLAEHEPAFTLGAGFRPEHLLHPVEELEARGFQVRKVDRGGDVTYHGPGQLVAYPVFDVARHGRDLHKWLRDLEEVVIRVVAGFGLEGFRFPPHTGVWLMVGGEPKKVCAMGVNVRKWVSTHGLALNVEGDLAPFDLIVPCGIAEYGVTSVAAATGLPASLADAKSRLVAEFEETFVRG